MPPKTPKSKAWEACARYCKIRDCLETTGMVWRGFCITCGKSYHIAFLEAGHMVAGRGLAVLFDVESIHTQCGICNRNFHGQPKKYEKIMAERKGQEWVDKRKIRAKRVVRAKIDFKKMEDGFKKRYRVLMRKHGFKTWAELLKAER